MTSLPNKWNERFLELAKHVASWSKDPSTQVGAIIVDPETRVVLGMGYNGFPRGVDDHPDRYANRELKYSLVVHAEANAILEAGKTCNGATLFV
jgi:dCMP deaminase